MPKSVLLDFAQPFLCVNLFVHFVYLAYLSEYTPE